MFLIIFPSLRIDWKKLPHHLLNTILKKLESLDDYIRFGAVCVSWSSARDFNRAKRNAVSRHHHAPKLLLPASSDEHAWRIYDVASNKFIGRELYVPYEERLSGSSQGWLLAVEKDWSATLYRPFSMTNKSDADTDRHTIRLPNLSFCTEYPVEIYQYIIDKTVITADPVANPNECVVFLIQQYGYLAYLRLGDSSWTRPTDPNFEEIVDVVLDGDRVFAVRESGSLLEVKNNGSMIAFEISDPINTVEVVAPAIRSNGVAWELECKCHRFLVRSPCSDDLLQIERYIDWYRDNALRYTLSFRVFKFAGKDKGWVRVRKLEDTCLFVGDSSSVSIRCSQFPGYRSNCVYFTHDKVNCSFRYGYGSNRNSDLGIYDLGEQKFEMHFSLNSTDFAAKTRCPIWVVPTL